MDQPKSLTNFTVILYICFLSEPKFVFLDMKVLIQISLSYSYTGHEIPFEHKKWGL